MCDCHTDSAGNSDCHGNSDCGAAGLRSLFVIVCASQGLRYVDLRCPVNRSRGAVVVESSSALIALQCPREIDHAPCWWFAMLWLCCGVAVALCV